MKIKICGLSREQDIEAVNEARPDYVGFVFAEKSHRKVSPQRAMMLRERLCPSIQAVGVFVNERVEVIYALAESGTLDMIQLHGNEDECTIEWVKALTGKPVIVSVAVRSRDDILKRQGTCADFLLLDNASGGSGERFDWSLIGNVTKPFFLAGGLDIGNIHDAIATTRPFAVDVSSGVETNRLKDPEKIKAIVNAVKVAQVF